MQNQGPCGDDVAFQIVHVVDCFHAIQTGDLELASIWDCCVDGACDGGLYDEDNYNCIVRIGGLALASEYESPDHKCLNGSFKPVVKINGGKFLTTKNETVMEYAVAMQPVVAAIDASHASFQLYESGVYYDPDCSQEELDHVILVVGYGTTDDGQEYWICQNSWGTHTHTHTHTHWVHLSLSLQAHPGVCRAMSSWLATGVTTVGSQATLATHSEPP